MNIEWNRVTWYSKLVAIVVFIGTAALFFFFGEIYGRTLGQIGISQLSSGTTPLSASLNRTTGTAVATGSQPLQIDLPLGDSGYEAVAERAKQKCGQNVQLAGTSVQVDQETGGFFTYYSFRGNCYSEVKIDPYHRPDPSDPIVTNIAKDNFIPIPLSDWKISAKQALSIAGMGNGSALNLSEESNTLVWAITYRNEYALSEARVNASMGELISKQTTRLPIY